MKIQALCTISVFSVILIFSNIQSSESTLWDLLITAEPMMESIEASQNPIIIGKVVDHAQKPVSNSEVKIRFGEEVGITSTNNDGEFLYTFDEKQRMPGKYIVNILATSENGKIGMSSTILNINGDIPVVFQLGYGLNEDIIEEKKEINFEKDPIAAILYKHELEKKAEIAEAEKKNQDLIKYQLFLNEQRQKANQKLQERIEFETLAGNNTYVGTSYYKEFISNIDKSVKDLMIDHLNYTNNVWVESERAMKQVIENGGTLQEARLAYFENAAMSREVMNKLIAGSDLTNDTTQDELLNGDVELASRESKDEFDKVENIIETNSTELNLGSETTILKINVNGTIIELLVNGTKVTQINSE